MPILFWLDVSALLVAAVVLTALVLLVLGGGTATRLGRLFLIFISIEIAWLVTSLLLRFSVWARQGDSLLFGELVGLSLVLTGPSLLAFAAEYVDHRGKWTRWAIYVGKSCAVISLVPIFTHRVLASPRLLSNGTTVVDVTGVGVAIASVPAILFGWAFVLYWQARRRTGETYLAWSVAVLLAGFVFGSVMNLPVPISSVTQTLSAALFGFGVVSRQLFNPLRERTAALQHEVAERERTERALRDSEQRFHAILDSVTDAIVVLELHTGRILEANRASYEMFGYTREELCQKTALELCAKTPPHTEAASRERLARSSAGEPAVFEWPLSDRDGRLFWAELSTTRAQVGSEERLLVTARDVSERRQAQEEQRLLQARVFHAQKLESLGVLAGGIAHDFNNLLSGILGFAELSRSEAPTGSRLAERLQRIQDAAKRAADLCRQLLAYAGHGRLSVEAVDLSAVVREMGELVHAAIAGGAALRLELANELPAVEGDAAQLTQVTLNLLVNASEALGERGGEIVVTTGVRYCDRQALASAYSREDLSEGNYVFLRVADTGSGMTEETQARLFDPFFTTKFAGRGLGLSAVLGIVRRHRGVIQVESRVGQGSVFTVLLPEAPHAVVVRSDEVAPACIWRGAGTILVVDDEPAARGAATAMLEETGFSVLEAADGEEGIAVYQAHADAIVAVLLDLTMPKMGGDQVLEALRHLRPDLRVILMSGYGEADVSARLAAARPDAFLEKPFRWGQLSEKLQRVLA
jgi:PAS domain S-box-containing protein